MNRAYEYCSTGKKLVHKRVPKFVPIFEIRGKIIKPAPST